MNNSVNNDNKRKSEILEKSRKLKKDEGRDFAEYRGTQIGVWVYAVVAIILMIFCIPNQMNIVNAIAALSFAWVVGGTFSHYRFTKKISYLLLTIASAIITVIFALMVILYPQ